MHSPQASLRPSGSVTCVVTLTDMLVDSVLLSEHSLLRIFRDVLGRLDDMGGVFTVV